MKRILVATVISLVLFLIPGVQIYASEDGLLDDYTDKTVVLQSNDVHGAIDGYKYMAGLRDELEDRGAHVILVDSGDFLQGSTEVAATKGSNAVRMMNKVGYDFVTIGNHELDYSYSTLTELLDNDNIDFKVICDNLIGPDGNAVYGPGKVFDWQYYDTDLKIGFFGITTPETQTKTSPSNLEGSTVLDNNTDPKIFDKAKADIAKLNEDSDVLICLSHLGVEEGSTPYRSYDLWNEAKDSGIDYILDGHSHSVMTEGESGEPIMSTGTKFENIGVITIDEKTKELDKTAKPFLYKVTEDSYVNDEVKKEANKIHEEIGEIYNAKVGTAEVELNGERNASSAKEHGTDFANGNRDGETNLGDFAADAMLWYALKDGIIYDVPEDHIVSIENGGSLRAGISKGDITRGDVLNVFPFGNPIEGVYVTGDKILEALEASTYSYPSECGGFPQVAGIEYTIDDTKSFDPADETYPGSTYYPPKSIKRVTIKNINGKAFSETDKYLVVTNSFVTDGGDTYGAFQGMPKITIHHLDEELVMKFISKELGGVIGEKYLEPAGRIKKNIDSASVELSSESFTYTGKVMKPTIKTIAGRELKEGRDYTAKWSDASSKNAGTYTVTITGTGVYDGSTRATYKINKAANTLKVKGKSYKIKAGKLSKKSKTIKAGNVISFISKGEGTRTFKKVSGTKTITINKKTGKVTLKKGLKKKTYTIKVKVRAAGNTNYKALTAKAINLKIKVK